MSNPPAIASNSSGPDHARKLLWPVAIIAFIFTVSYTTNDVITGGPAGDELSIGMFLLLAGIALVTAVVVFAVVLPRALRRESSGAVALALSIVGFLLAPGFWTGFPPALAAGGALLGWAGIKATKGRSLSQAAFVVGLLGVIANVVSYADVFI